MATACNALPVPFRPDGPRLAFLFDTLPAPQAPNAPVSHGHGAGAEALKRKRVDLAGGFVAEADEQGGIRGVTHHQHHLGGGARGPQLQERPADVTDATWNQMLALNESSEQYERSALARKMDVNMKKVRLCVEVVRQTRLCFGQVNTKRLHGLQEYKERRQTSLSLCVLELTNATKCVLSQRLPMIYTLGS